MNRLSTKNGSLLAGLVVLALAWSGVAGFDWMMRVRWFQWHRSFLPVAAKPRYMGDRVPLSTNTVQPRVGGDLSALIGLPDVAERYAVGRTSSYAMVSDEYGFPNEPPTAGWTYPLVFVGDSFFLQGEGMDKLPAQRVARRLGVPAYTLAHAGRGANFALSGFLDHPLFATNPPRALVWGMIERDATGYFFDSMAFEIMGRVIGRTAEVAGASARLRWGELAPARLRTTLPNTSIAAQFARRAWTWLRYRLLGALTPDVLVSRGDVEGRPLLFYRDSLHAMAWPAEVRDVPKIQRAAHFVNRDYFQTRGIRWVVLLIPDKEQVYRELLPDRPQTRSLPPSCFDAIELALREEGILVVNLLPVFRAAAARGELLYWPDDTHWNDAGMELAARAVADALLADGVPGGMGD